MTDLLFGDRISRAARALASAGIPYAFGGAIALGFHAEPRLTRDLDINIFLPETAAGPVLDALAAVGVTIDGDGPRRLIERDGQVRLRWDHVPVDLFFATVPFLEVSGTRIRHVPWGPETIPILSAEDLIVCKVLFNRPRDWVDIGSIVMLRANTLDVGHILAWLDDMLGPTDERVTRFRRLVEGNRAD